MRTVTRSMEELTTQVGVGDHAAFRRLYAAYAPGVLAAVQGEMPDPIQAMHVVRATFCEVWRMCAFNVRFGTTPADLPMWIATIAQRRGDERRHALVQVHRRVTQGESAYWAGLLEDRDRWTQAELAIMLDGRDDVAPEMLGQ